MRILITGSEGFVGRHLANKLLNNHEVVKYDLKNGEDVLNKKKLSEVLIGCDVVIHLAAYVLVDESWKKPQKYFENNGLGTLNTITESVKAGVKRFIYFSSAAVYGDPLTPYGGSKLWGETICEVYKNKIDVIVFRPFNIYGKGQNPSYGYAIHNFINAIINNQKIQIYGDGKQTRDFINIEDVVTVVEYSLQTNEVTDFPIDVGTGTETSINDLATLVGKSMKRDIDVEYKPGKIEPARSCANTSGLKGLGIDLARFKSLKEGVKELLR